jgi:hypothetical protein
MNRRQFAYVSALAGVVAGTRGQGAAAQTGRIPEAAGLITEMVFLDDCIRIAMYDSTLSAAAKTALTEQADFVRDGALSPAGSGAKSSARFALSAGRLWSEVLNQHRQPNSAEARLFQDIAVMRDLAVGSGCDPSKPGPVGDLLDILHVRRRLGLHTLIPDDSSIETTHAWLEGVVSWWKDQRELRNAIAAAYTSPDKSKMKEFAAGFYNASDPLIRLARGFQFAQLMPPDALPSALERARQGAG